jgi:hypothetical protein
VKRQRLAVRPQTPEQQRHARYMRDWRNAHPENADYNKRYQARYRKKHRAELAQYKREWYQENKAHHQKLTRKWQRANVAKVRAIKAKMAVRNRAIIAKAKNKPCRDCRKRKTSRHMHFDHVRGKRKFWIGRKQALGYSAETLKAEIAKCEIRCSSCHRKRHARATRRRKSTTKET